MGEAAAVLEVEVDDSGREVNRGARVVKRKEKKRVHHRSIPARCFIFLATFFSSFCGLFSLVMPRKPLF